MELPLFNPSGGYFYQDSFSCYGSFFSEPKTNLRICAHTMFCEECIDVRVFLCLKIYLPENHHNIARYDFYSKGYSCMKLHFTDIKLCLWESKTKVRQRRQKIKFMKRKWSRIKHLLRVSLSQWETFVPVSACSAPNSKKVSPPCKRNVSFFVFLRQWAVPIVPKHFSFYSRTTGKNIASRDMSTVLLMASQVKLITSNAYEYVVAITSSWVVGILTVIHETKYPVRIWI